MERALIASMGPSPVQGSAEGHGKELFKGIEAAQKGTPILWGTHSLLNSHQSWEEAGSLFYLKKEKDFSCFIYQLYCD